MKNDEVLVLTVDFEKYMMWKFVQEYCTWNKIPYETKTKNVPHFLPDIVIVGRWIYTYSSLFLKEDPCSY